MDATSPSGAAQSKPLGGSAQEHEQEQRLHPTHNPNPNPSPNPNPNPSPNPTQVASAPRHEGAAWGWALYGLLDAATGLPLSRLLHVRLLAPLGLADSMYLGLPLAEAHR